MFTKSLAVVSVLSLIFAAAAQESDKRPANAPENRCTCRMSDDEARALRADITRMKSQLLQLRTNLAEVSASQSPLKHEFEIEAQMWQSLIDQMERRLPPQ